MNTFVLEAGLSAAIFLVIWMVVGNRVFKPFLANLEEREERTKGDEKRAVAARAKAQQLSAKFEEEIKQARLAGIRHRDDYVATAKAEAAKIVEQALDRSMRELDTARAELDALKGKVRTELSQEAQVLSGAILDKLLRGSGERLIH